MKTSEVINELVDSLKCFGDLPTNIRCMSWYCPSENGSFEGVHLHTIDDSDELIEDEFIDIEEITIRDKTIGFPNGEWTARNMDKAFAYKINSLIKNQKKIIDKLKEEGK